MMDALTQAFTFDIHMRRDVDEKFPGEGIKTQSHDIQEGVIVNKGPLKVTAFSVDHGPVNPAFGYRVDYGDHSVVLSGDTRFSNNLVTFAKGADVLIHEAILVPDQGPKTKLEKRIIAHHTTGEQAGEIFKRVHPRLAVLSHAPNILGLFKKIRRTYNGPLQQPEDLTVITVGEQIRVQDWSSLISAQK